MAGLYKNVDRLERIFPGRRFTPDGHLVGSLGEVIASYMFDLRLRRSSTAGHDAQGPDGREVEVKLTQGDKVAFRKEPKHAIVLRRQKQEQVRVVFNGPGSVFWEEVGKAQRNGQRSISVKKLHALDARVPDEDRLPQVKDSPL